MGVSSLDGNADNELG
jgi:hypothetical protein